MSKSSLTLYSSFLPFLVAIAILVGIFYVKTQSNSTKSVLGASTASQPVEQTALVTKKLLGIFPVVLTQTIILTADNSQPLRVEESPLNHFLDLISF